MSIIALCAALGALLLNASFRWLTTQLGQAQLAGQYSWLVSTSTMPSLFAMFYAVYDRRLWRVKIGPWRLSKVPYIGGTWVGESQPNYQSPPVVPVGWPHKEVWVIEQTWSSMFVHTTVVSKPSADAPWVIASQYVRGTAESITAFVGGMSAGRIAVWIGLRHTGRLDEQNSFPAAYDATITRRHDSACDVEVGDTVDVRYFTGKGRNSYGPMELVYRAPKSLDALGALREEQTLLGNGISLSGALP